MLDIGKLIPGARTMVNGHCFSSMLDIGKLIPRISTTADIVVLAQCWI